MTLHNSVVLGAMAAASGLLAACGEPTTPAPEPSAPVALTPAGPPPAPLAQTAPGLPPPAATPNRFVGRWAAAETACGHAVWIFRLDGLSGPAGQSCRFDRVTPKPGGYDIDATCAAEMTPAPSRIGVTFADSARAMLAEGGPFSAPVGLIYCGA